MQKYQMRANIQIIFMIYLRYDDKLSVDFLSYQDNVLALFVAFDL
jgi:hypothetical protein